MITHIVIPYYNSLLIKSVLEEILVDAFIKNNNCEVIVVCSNCKDQYIYIAKQFENKFITKKIKYTVLTTLIAGKPHALNVALNYINNKYDETTICILCDDILFEKDSIQTMSDILESNPTIGVVSLYNQPMYSNKKILCEVQMLHHRNFYKYENYYLTGRAFAFRTNLIKQFPTNLISEDLFLYCESKIHNKSVLTLENNKVYYLKPSNYLEYFNMIKRYDYSFRQFKDSFPELFHNYISDKDKKSYEKFAELLGGESDKLILKTVFRYFKSHNIQNISKIIYFFITLFQAFILPIYYNLNKNKYNSGYYPRENSTTE